MNSEVSINPNGGANNGASLGVNTPLPANYPACEIEQPSGECYAVGKYHSIRTNETYSLVFNSNGVNYWQRIDGNGKCEIVYVGDCLQVSAAPRYAVEQWKGHMRIEKVCKNRDGKYLQWVDGDGVNGYIDTEASIATNFFTTPFFDICRDSCAYINLCVPQPCGCLHAEFVPLAVGDEKLTNYVLDKGIKLMFKHVYYDGRASEWSDRSSLYYQDSKKCFSDGIGAPRCLKVRLPIGNPMVEKIIVGYSIDGGLTWYEYETIEKYKKYNSSQDKWYNRQLSEQVQNTFDAADCAFDYFFCNDKEKKSISPLQVSRVRNEMPRKPFYLMPIGEAVGYGNYEDGNCPIDKIETEKVNIDVDCPADAECDTLYSTVTVRAVIHAIGGNNTFIYRLGADKSDDEYTENTYFGGNGAYIPTPDTTENILSFGQQFVEKTKNFIVYIEGTNYWGEMKQWKADANFTNPIFNGVVKNMAEQTEKNKWALFISGGGGVSGGGFFFQEYKFKVPKGTRGFLRLVSYEQTDGSIPSQNTSSPVVGIVDITNYTGYSNVRAISDLSRQEIYFDTCDGDTDLGNQAFVIASVANTVPNTGTGVGYTAYTGYITDAAGLPVEGAVVSTRNDMQTDPNWSRKTDHNGFYYMRKGTNIVNGIDQVEDFTVYVHVEKDCGAFQTIQTFDISTAGLVSVKRDEQIRDTNYRDNFFALIKVRIVDCNNVRITGVTVAASGSKARTTNQDGFAIFRIRNFDTRNRVVKLVVMDEDACLIKDCGNNCNPCLPTNDVLTPACYNTNPEIIAGDLAINTVANLIKAGLKAGGRYGFAFVLEGDCGRLSAVNEVKYIDMPKTQDKNKLSFCSFTYDASGIVLPSWGKCFKIVRTINKNPYELQWVVDKITRDANGRIILTIQSLNDYNAGAAFKTNTVYQWLENDRIEFIRNGDGSIFTTAQYGLLNYQTVSPLRDITLGDASATINDVNYYNQLVILDDGRLVDLKEGAVIEMQRPQQGTDENTYFEICASINVIQIDNGDGTTHGELETPIGVFNTFDTYFVRRRIKDFLGTFEHFSPSDYWGKRLDDTGKVHFVNKYETERRFGRKLTIASPTQVNYFGDSVKTFDANEQGDIMALWAVDDNIVMGICENDNFLAQIANDLLRLGANNVVVAQPADSIVSDPQAKPIGQYGCQYDHIGSIIFYDGGACWADVNKYAYVRHDYNLARDVAENKVKVYTQKRYQEIEFVNRSATNDLDKLRFCTGQNSQTKSVYTTIKKLRDSGINNEKAPFLKTNDTLIYNPIIDEFLGFASFTPEGYSQVNLFDGSGAAFLTYLNGVPYYHPVLAEKWNEWFGQSCDQFIGISVNQFQNKEKVFLAMEIQSEQKYFVDSVETDKPNYLSEIPAVKVKRHERKWNAAFMGNKNSRAGLFGNEPPRGFYCKVLLVKDNTNNDIYGSINDAKRTEFNQLDEIITKFITSEQTGMTENV